MYYTVKYSGTFGFIKPWTAVRDAGGGETYSQQFLTPSIIEGMRQKLEVSEIVRHKLTYLGINLQQEVIQAKAWEKKNKIYTKNRSILKRGVMLYPTLYLAFSNIEDAEKSYKQHICLCRNEDVLLPVEIKTWTEEEFNQIAGYELRFEENEKAFMVGYNRFNKSEQMFGWLEITGNPIQNPVYE
ncbi:MAG: hypothetical protein LBQ01_01310 [Prevotellaceae bacterium]|jgi:hypothetical protein|nr:hypothetical protein [Prevotellaceae bacterium]